MVLVYSHAVLQHDRELAASLGRVLAPPESGLSVAASGGGDRDRTGMTSLEGWRRGGADLHNYSLTSGLTSRQFATFRTSFRCPADIPRTRRRVVWHERANRRWHGASEKVTAWT